LLHRAIVRGHAAEVPAPLARTIARHAAAASDRTAALVAELHRIRAALDSAGVVSIPLKGLWLNQRLYGDVSIRISRDIDVMIRPEATGAALQALAKSGYAVPPVLSARQLTAKARYAGQFLLHRHDGAFAIEPHWALAPHTLSLGLDHRALWQRSRVVAAGGFAMPALAPEDEFIMLCVHGFKEEWNRIRLIADLARFVLVYPSLDWDEVAARAQAQRVWWIVLVGLLLISTMFGIDTALSAAARGIRQPARVACHLLTRLTETAASPAQVPPDRNIYNVSAERRRMRERRLDRARYVLRTIATPREAHFRTVRLPDRLFPLYVGVKLLHDYVLLPCWLLGKMLRHAISRPPVAVGAVIRAAR
jgi:hypothetical protein